MPFTRTPKSRDKSPSSTPVPSTEAVAPVSDGSQLPAAEWTAMSKILNDIYDFRTEDGFDPSKLFHRKPNKRYLPEYYDTIREPIALSTIKAKINARAYQTFEEFVRDFALIPHNAQVFNVPDSGAFQDALVIKAELERQLQMLVKEGLITQETATLPDLGEIPKYDATAEGEKEVEGEDDEDSDEEGEEEDEDEDGDDEDGRKKRRRNRPSKRDTVEDGDGVRSRGRPPKLMTPLEGRVNSILKGLRKPRSSDGQLLIRDFDRLPDKATMPEYFNEIRNPMAYDQLKRKAKRKKYKTLEEFMADVNLIFNNAKSYNTDESQIYKDAVALQIEAGRLYDEERAKPDDSFADEEGKIPLPNGILHNGELYKVGDWVHIQNANDLTKPIPAQIYRTYRTSEGQSMVNVCWYYRPEQTIHRFDKHFYPNELVKTGRYRDHRVEEIEGKCFIMFYTRFFKGRPRGLPAGLEVYVCQTRYNEASPQFNTIKTWASCLPDEVRDKDYEMDLFDQPRRAKKVPSPIAYLLKDEQKETDDFPKAQWGADGAPPKIGAVHRRPRPEKDSPPPEPTPPPPARQPTPPPPLRQIPPTPQASTPGPAQTQMRPSLPGGQPSYTPARPPSASAPVAGPQRSLSGQQSNPRYPSTPQPPPSTVQRPNMMPQHSSGAQHSNNMQHTPAGPPASMSTPAPQHSYTPRQYSQPPAANATAALNPASTAAQIQHYRDPPPIEVYTLPDFANLSIPAEIRARFQRDAADRVLFFPAPPRNVSSGATTPPAHSVRYLAEKARRKDELERKRHLALQTDERERADKRAKVVQQAHRDQQELEALQREALMELTAQLAATMDTTVAGSTVNRAKTAATRTAGHVRTPQQKSRTATQFGLGNGLSTSGGGVVFADDHDSRIGA